MQHAADFDALYTLVDEGIGQLHGIGDLTVYDTALRIGAKLDLKPRWVYLHGGTRQGARALGLQWRLPHLPSSAFPPQLRQLQPYEIEDCVCIFKDKLATKKHRRGRAV